MLDLLTKHLTVDTSVCKVAQWIKTLSEDEQKAFDALRENNAKVNNADLYKDLSKEVTLSFGMTAFRSHMRGYCTCQKN